jgi:putative phosphoribosyl transferase
VSSAGIPIRRRAPFGDRRRAGQLLADELAAMQLFDPIVVALPRGGVPVGREIADRLGAPLEVFGVRKLAHPGRPEFGFGAIAEDGTRLVDPESARVLGLHNGEVDRITAREREELRRRVDLYRATAARSRTSAAAWSWSSTTGSPPG